MGPAWDALTVEQEDAYLDWLDAYEKAQKEATEAIKAGR